MNDSINSSLKRLRESLEQGNPVDEETLALAQGLEIDIQKALDSETHTTESAMDLALILESRFEASHPVAAACIKEVINTLQKMGV